MIELTKAQKKAARILIDRACNGNASVSWWM